MRQRYQQLAQAVVAVLVAAAPMRAQLLKLQLRHPPTVPVTINHPAKLGINLSGRKVAFSPVSGACAQQFSDLMAEDFLNEHVVLVNRTNIDAIMTENHFQVGSSVDPATAVKLGKLSGAAIVVFVEMERCIARRAGLLREKQFIGQPLNISRTDAHFRASVHTVDLTTGQELAVKPIQSDPSKQNRAVSPDIAEYPDEIELQDEAVRDAAAQAHQLYFPWTESRLVSFMNGKECNLKQAYDLLKTGDISRVLQLSQENVGICKSDPKPVHQADAHYNLGIAYMLAGDYDKALGELTEAQGLHDDKTTVEAIADCRKARAGAAATTRRQERDAGEDAAEKHNQQKREEEAAKSVLTNSDVLQFVKDGWSDDLIVKTIASEPAKFSLAISDLRALKQARVSDRVVAAMLDKK